MTGSNLSESVSVRLTRDELEGIRAVAGRTGLGVSELIRGSVRTTSRQRPVYSFTGEGPSLLQDLWAEYHPNEHGPAEVAEARDRLHQFNLWRKEITPTLVKLADTSTAADVIEPQYKPLLADFVQDRPLFDAATRGTIASSTPFNLPAELDDGDVDDAMSDHTEGADPVSGDLTFVGQTISPGGVSGSFTLTREIADSSNPAIDAIALQAMRSSYARKTEAKLFAALNAAQSGTVTAGHVPSGAAVRTSSGAGLPADLRAAVASYTDTRGRRPRSVVASSRPSVAEELAVLDDSSADGSEEFWRVANTPVFLSPQISGTAAGDGDVFILSSGDVFAWSSPLLELRYWERSGPGHVEVSSWGYFACAVLAPRGVSAVRHT